MTPVQKVLARLSEVRRSGNGWSARCPAHDDQHASLSVTEGDDGKALVKCFAGCEAEAVCAALGLPMSELFPTSNVLPAPSSSKSRPERPKGETFATANDAVADLERRYGERSALWTYRNAGGEPVGVVARWDSADGKKSFRPVSRNGDGWWIGGMPEPRPLYGLPELAGARRVYVCEGEKAADAVRGLGLAATTSAHGCNSPDKSDWEPLAGKEIILLPDNDPSGRKYADGVAALAAKLTPAAVVKLVELPGLPDHGDAADFVADHAGTDADELRRIIDALADDAEPIQATPPAHNVERYVPFPVDALPEPVRGFVVAGAKAIGCDESYLALAMLVALAAAIGTSRRLQLKRGWTAPAILWVAIVGESGTAKTPAFRLAMRAIRERQDKAWERHKDEMRNYLEKILEYEKARREWTQRKDAVDGPPTKPEVPSAERFIVSDTTVEALAPLLLANPRGLLLARDELAGWIGSFDRYAGGKGGSDASHWLSMHGGIAMEVDRKSHATIVVPHAAVCICGGIQPAILRRALGDQHRESGLLARLLLTCPPRVVKKWTEADICPEAEATIAKLVDRLYELLPTFDDDGKPRPVVVGMSPDAKAVWTDFYNAHAKEQADLTGDLAAAWSKFEEYAARLALVIDFARWAAGDPTLASADVLDVVSMEAGVRLATWFKGEARRVYAMLDESEDDRDRRRLVEWIGRRGGTATPRDVQMGCRWLRSTGAAEAALNELVKAGIGAWRQPSTTAKGGRPAHVFELSTPSTVNGTHTNPSDYMGSVDVDTAVDPDVGPLDGAKSEPPTTPDDEWGEV